MARTAVTRTWYRIALAQDARPPMLVAAHGEHLGEAVAAAEKHVAGSYAVAAQVATGDDIPLGESVGKSAVMILDGTPTVSSTFHWPLGVLPELDSGDVRLDAKRGFAVHGHDKLNVIEAMPARDEVVEVFLGLVEKLPAGDNLEVRVLDHYENAGTTDVWLTSRVNTNKIVRFLDDHDVELIGNGHIELSIYVRKHRATLRLTEHKTIVWLADNRDLEPDVLRWMHALELPRLDELVTVTRVPHFHYRPVKSRDRKKLGDELFRQRLRRVDTLRVEPARETAG